MSKRKKSKVVLMIFVVVLIYFSYTVIKQQLLLDNKKDQLEAIEKKVADETELNKDLKKLEEDVNSNEYIEKVAREKIGLVKDGERVFVDINK